MPQASRALRLTADRADWETVSREEQWRCDKCEQCALEKNAAEIRGAKPGRPEGTATVGRRVWQDRQGRGGCERHDGQLDPHESQTGLQSLGKRSRGGSRPGSGRSGRRGAVAPRAHEPTRALSAGVWRAPTSWAEPSTPSGQDLQERTRCPGAAACGVFPRPPDARMCVPAVVTSMRNLCSEAPLHQFLLGR